ncbi:alpha/beta hydrolase [Isosphaeraceae bacterium EP7]
MVWTRLIPGPGPGLVAALMLITSAGCASPGVRAAGGDTQESKGFLLFANNGKVPELEVPRLKGPDDVAPGKAGAESTGVETWMVHTRASEQTTHSDFWRTMDVSQIDPAGGAPKPAPARTLLNLMAGRTVVILVHGNNYSYEASTREALRVRDELAGGGGFTSDALFLIFDWPSERLRPGLVGDLNEKARRSRIAGSHLAMFLREAPPETKVCLMGQSDGGRVVLTTLHLLSGAELPKFLKEPAIQLESGRSDLHMRVVTLEAAVGHHWMNPGERLQHAVGMTEGWLNLFNRFDYALAVYGLGQYTGVRSALGRSGLRPDDLRKLGDQTCLIEQMELHSIGGLRHLIYVEALSDPEVLQRVTRYTSWAPVPVDPGGKPSQPSGGSVDSGGPGSDLTPIFEGMPNLR